MMVLLEGPCPFPFSYPNPPSISSLCFFSIRSQLLTYSTKVTLPLYNYTRRLFSKPPLGLNIISRSFSVKIKY
jgi:hypothetical protein